MTKRNVDLTNRAIIVELNKESYNNEIIMSKRGIQKIIEKYDTTGLYEDKKRSGRPVKLS